MKDTKLPPKIINFDFNSMISWDLLELNKYDIIIIDNFSSNCGSIRNEALAKKYEKKFTESGYEYNYSIPEPTTIDRSLSLIFRLIGKDVENFILSYFVYETKENEVKTKIENWIHCDPWKWVGLHYLNLPEQEIGGTSFYQYVSNNNYSFNYDKDNSIEQIKKDGVLAEKWKLFHEVSLKWNRLLLFKPSFFHSPSCYFGTNITNARLYQLFTIN